MKRSVIHISLLLILYLCGAATLRSENITSTDPEEITGHSILTLKPTFVCCSFYFPAETGTDCKVRYKETGSGQWKDAFQPYYDGKRKEYRGSLVRLSENTKYEIKVSLEKEGRNIQNWTDTFTTWNSHPSIAKEIPISSFKADKDGSLIIKELKGKVDGWIKIKGDKPINGGDTKEAALYIDKCEYVIFENLYVTGGFRHGIKTNENVKEVRFVNCEITRWGRKTIRQTKDGHYLDRDGNMINNDGGITVYRSKNVVIERCYIHDPNGYTNPWNGTIDLGEFKGQKYTFAHPQGPNAVYIMQAGGGLVLRYNDLIGSQTHRYNDPVEGWENRSVNGGVAKDADVYGNVLAFGQDDAIELDGGQCNVRIFDNRMEQTYCGISTAPNRKGPSYIFNNVIWNQGNSMGLTGNAIKNGGGPTFTQGMQYLIHNTIIHNGGGMAGVGYGKDSNRELFNAFMRNNIIYSQIPVNNPGRKGYNIYDPHLNPACDFDYDMLGNSTEKGGKGEIIAVKGSEKHAVYASPTFSNYEHGILTPATDNPGIDKGEILNNFTDRYSGTKPDMGAYDRKEKDILFPARPVDMNADKYCIHLKKGKTEKIKIRIGKIEEQRFDIRMNDDMKAWLHVEASSDRAVPGTELVLTLKPEGNVNYKKNGMLFFRLAEGFSIPVTVTGE